MTHAEKGAQYFCDGYNCSQSVVLAYCDDLKLDKELALKYLLKAVHEGPKDPYSYFFLAELYFDQSEYDKAEQVIQQGLDLGVRTDYFLEDKRGRWHLKELLKKVKKKQQ